MLIDLDYNFTIPPSISGLLQGRKKIKTSQKNSIYVARKLLITWTPTTTLGFSILPLTIRENGTQVLRYLCSRMLTL